MKIVVATIVVVGIVVGLINLKLEPHSLLLESSPKRPNWLPWLSWGIASLASILYIVLDFIENSNGQIGSLFQISKDFILPIILGVATYILVDRLGEWKKRRNYSILGIVIIESLQEEVKTGINFMTKALVAATSEPLGTLARGTLPDKTWEGMTTIPDEVLLRIIATSGKRKYDGFPVRECRIHCELF